MYIRITNSIILFFFSEKGGAFPVLFILAAEYVSPKARAIVLSILWAATTVAIMSLSGVGYIVANRRNLMLSMTLPILLGILLLK